MKTFSSGAVLNVQSVISGYIWTERKEEASVTARAIERFTRNNGINNRKENRLQNRLHLAVFDL